MISIAISREPTITVYIGCILSNIVVHYTTNSVSISNDIGSNLRNLYSKMNFSKILFDSYCVLYKKILNFRYRIHCENPPQKIVCTTICGSVFPHMRYAIPQPWVPQKSRYCQLLMYIVKCPHVMVGMNPIESPERHILVV